MKKSCSASFDPRASVLHGEGKPVRLKLEIQYATRAAGVPARPMFRKWVRAALMHDAEIGLRVVDEAEGRDLNRDFRGKDYATNVLTFAYGESAPGTRPGTRLTGDIVLCAPILENEANQQSKSLIAHYAHLTVHGVLHLQGYDHEREAEASAMEQRETEILRKLGYSDPYAEHPVDEQC